MKGNRGNRSPRRGHRARHEPDTIDTVIALLLTTGSTYQEIKDALEVAWHVKVSLSAIKKRCRARAISTVEVRRLLEEERAEATLRRKSRDLYVRTCKVCGLVAPRRGHPYACPNGHQWRYVRVQVEALDGRWVWTWKRDVVGKVEVDDDWEEA